MDFAQRLQSLMAEKGVTSYKVAKDIGISGGNIRSWLDGKSRPKEQNMKKICDYFGVTPQYFSENQESMDAVDKILYHLRKKRMTEIELTTRLGIYKTAVTDWKVGKTKSYVKYIPQIAEVLDVSPEYLLEKSGPETSEVILDHIAAHGLTAYKVAQGTGISESTFSKWKTNPTSNITTEVLTKIADFLHISVPELLGLGSSDAKKAPPTLEEAEEAYVKALIEHGYLKKGKGLTAEEMDRLRRAARIALED